MGFQVHSQDRRGGSGRTGMINSVAGERHGREAMAVGKREGRALPEVALERYLQIPTYLRWGRKLAA